jgi:transcriptional regulator with XRE-family HTH domain
LSTSLKELTIDWKAVGRRVRTLRGFDTKQADYAELLGVSQSHMSAIEHGQKEASATILLRIAKNHGKTLEWLLIGTGEKIK